MNIASIFYYLEAPFSKSFIEKIQNIFGGIGIVGLVFLKFIINTMFLMSIAAVAFILVFKFTNNKLNLKYVFENAFNFDE